MAPRAPLPPGVLGGVILLAMALPLLGAIAWHRSDHGPIRIYYELIAVQDTPALPVFALILIAALVHSRRFEALLPILNWVSRNIALLSALSLFVYCLGAFFVYQRHPLSMDEFMPTLQSRIFAEGRIFGGFPVELIERAIPPLSIDYFYVTNRQTGEFVSGYWPGLALLQTPFAPFGLNWLVNPLLTAASLPVLDSLLRKLGFDDELRGLALLTWIASAVIAINAMGMYSMPLMLFANLAFTRLILENDARALIAAGFLGSVCLVANNPVPHTLYALPWIAWLALRPEGGLRQLLPLAIGYLPLSVALGVGWPTVLEQFPSATGAVFTGIDFERYLKIFSPPSTETVIARIYAIVKIDQWAVPGLLGLALAGAYRWRTPQSRCLAASALLTFFGYLLVPFDQGHGWGFRYFHQSWLTLPILAVGALTTLQMQPNLLLRYKGFLLASCLGSLFLLLPLRMHHTAEFIDRHLAQLPARVIAEGKQIIFIDPTCGYYIQDLFQNDPFLRGDDLRFVSLGADRDAALAGEHLQRPSISGSTKCASRWVDLSR